VDHLVELGHKKIYNIAGKSSMETGKRRQNAFKKAITKVGLTFSPDLIVEEEYSVIGGQRGFQEIFKRKPKATAIVVSEFNMAVGALNAARKANVMVPEDLSMVAFNNLEFASLLNPSLTTVGLQLQHLGEEGLNLLLLKEPDEEIYQTVSKSAELFLRESSKSNRK
jgi:DNA-binding LacI/PurR family transcriptional regulator